MSRMPPLDGASMVGVMNGSSPGYRYWVERLRPYAAAGFKRGVLDDRVVELEADDGRRVVLQRPRRWQAAADLLRDLEATRILEPDRRHELGQAGRALLAAIARIGGEAEP